jgi:ribosomal protein S18 acetylase RimI-like enzyme
LQAGWTGIQDGKKFEVIMGHFTIRKATDEDADQLTEVSARAFEHDPLTDWLVEDQSNVLQAERQMFLAEWRISKRYDLIFTDSDRQGVAVWKPPGAKVTIGDRIRQVWSMIGSIKLSRRTLAKIRLFLDVEKAHPKEPHYYLSLLAVVPEMQGKGLGSALMQPILDLCNREGIPAYLETETESNVSFYSRKGFNVRQEILTSDGKSKVWTMFREPKMSNT